jgi:polar amino acid transport system permease protein
MSYDWNFDAIISSDNIALLESGAAMTVELSALSIVIGTVLGIVLGALATAGSPSYAPLRPSIASTARRQAAIVTSLLALVRFAALSFVDIVRSIPLLLTVLLAYYAVPILLPDIDRTNVFLPCLIAFSLNLAAFVGELVRAGVVALPPGIILAARSLGMTPRQTWWRIVLPQIVRDILPAQVVLCITIIKMTTLASAVSLYEILHSGENIIQRTYRPLEVYTLIGIFFVVLIVPLALIARRLEATSVFRRREL